MGNFPKFRWKNSKLSVLPENWHTWYLGGADSKSTLRFLKFRLQNTFLGKFGPKSQNNYVYDFISPRSLTLLQFGALCTLCCIYVLWACNIIEKKFKVVCLAWKLVEYLEDNDSYSNISFLDFQSYIHFWGNLVWKSQSYLFCLKIGTHTDTHTDTHRHTNTHTHTHTHRVYRGCWFIFWN